MKLTKITNLPLLIFVTVSVCWHTTLMAAPLDALPNSPHPNATLPAMEARIDSFGASFWNFVKGASIVLGLFLVITSLIRIRDINMQKKEGSILGAFFGAVIGGMMSGVAIWLFAFAKTAEDLAGATG